MFSMFQGLTVAPQPPFLSNGNAKKALLSTTRKSLHGCAKAENYWSMLHRSGARAHFTRCNTIYLCPVRLAIFKCALNAFELLKPGPSARLTRVKRIDIFNRIRVLFLMPGPSARLSGVKWADGPGINSMFFMLVGKEGVVIVPNPSMASLPPIVSNSFLQVPF